MSYISRNLCRFANILSGRCSILFCSMLLKINSIAVRKRISKEILMSINEKKVRSLNQKRQDAIENDKQSMYREEKTLRSEISAPNVCVRRNLTSFFLVHDE